MVKRIYLMTIRPKGEKRLNEKDIIEIAEIVNEPGNNNYSENKKDLFFHHKEMPVSISDFNQIDNLMKDEILEDMTREEKQDEKVTIGGP